MQLLIFESYQKFPGLKSLIFPNSIRSPNGGVLILLHYTNQLILSAKTFKYTLQLRKSYDKFSKIFKIDGIEIIKRRENGNKAHLIEIFVCKLDHFERLQTILLLRSLS